MQTVQCLICGKVIEAKTKAALGMRLHAHMRMHTTMEEWNKKHGVKNPFPVKTQSTRIIKGNKYWYAGRTQYLSKAHLELQILVEQGIGGAVTQREGWYLLWTRKPVWVDLSEPLY